MLDRTKLQKLVGNVLNGVGNSNCRLCLNEIDDKYVSFDDLVSLDPDSEQQLVSRLVARLFGEEMISQIPGIDCLCIICVDKVIEFNRFLVSSTQCNTFLSKVIDDIESALNQETDLQTKKLILNITDDSLEIVQIKTKEKATKKSLYECTICNIVFQTLDILTNHNAEHHSKSTCNNCFEVFNETNELKDHKCEGKDCNHCQQHFDSHEELLNHIEVEHNIICSTCGKHFVKRDRFKIHEKVHKSSKHKCEHCGKSYLTSSSFEKHVQLCSKGLLDPHPRRSELVRDYACTQCDKRYSTPGGLRIHQRFAHGNARPHVCELCNKKFVAPSYLKAHMVTHTREKNFQCDICNHKFVSKESLLYHTRRHTGDRPYKCNQCSETFVNASTRAEHIKYKHNKPQAQCNICFKKFFNAKYLEKHVKKHNDRTSKLYIGRTKVPANLPRDENKRVICLSDSSDTNDWCVPVNSTTRS